SGKERRMLFNLSLHRLKHRSKTGCGINSTPFGSPNTCLSSHGSHGSSPLQLRRTLHLELPKEITILIFNPGLQTSRLFSQERIKFTTPMMTEGTPESIVLF